MDDVEEDKPQARAPGEPTDVDLVRAYREGDVHAFEELHRRYVASIYRLVRPQLRDTPPHSTREECAGARGKPSLSRAPPRVQGGVPPPAAGRRAGPRGGAAAAGAFPGRQAQAPAGGISSQPHRPVRQMRPPNRPPPPQRPAQECCQMRVSTVGMKWPG